MQRCPGINCEKQRYYKKSTTAEEEKKQKYCDVFCELDWDDWCGHRDVRELGGKWKEYKYGDFCEDCKRINKRETDMHNKRRAK
jgi:hypothetical protein